MVEVDGRGRGQAHRPRAAKRTTAKHIAGLKNALDSQKQGYG